MAPPSLDSATVTVVVPCYNQAHFLGECLGSILAQTRSEWQVIVVDDASPDSDRIREVVEGFGDDRIRIVEHEKNSGLAAARNTGIRSATTPLAYALDADDWLAPETLATLLPAMEGDPELDCAYADVQLFGRRNDVLTFPGPPDGGHVIFAEHTIPGSGTMMRRSFWERVGGYDESDILRHGREDFEFWVRAFSQGCKFKRVESKPLYQYRISHSSMAVDCRLKDHEITDYIYDKHRAVFDNSGNAKYFRCIGYRMAAEAAHIKGQHWNSFALAFKAFRLLRTKRHLALMAASLIPSPIFRRLREGELKRLVPFAGYPLRNAQQHRPFFIIGVGRSGNTLLRRILTSHSELHIPPETFVLGECIRKYKQYRGKLSWADLVPFILGRFAFHPESYTFEADLAPLVNRMKSIPLRRRNLANLLDGFFAFHAEVHGQTYTRWGDKTPLNSLDDALTFGSLPKVLGQGVPETLELLLEVFPDAQFVHIYRDGVDVTSSFLRGGFVRDPMEAAGRWLHTQQQTARFVREHPAACHAVRYEELVTQPETVLRGVCEFLGVPFEEEMLVSDRGAAQLGDVPAWSWHKQVAKPINPSNPGKGRAAFTPEERTALQALLGDELATLGYPPVA